jgi:hypothetical protein
LEVKWKQSVSTTTRTYNPRIVVVAVVGFDVVTVVLSFLLLLLGLVWCVAVMNVVAVVGLDVVVVILWLRLVHKLWHCDVETK